MRSLRKVAIGRAKTVTREVVSPWARTWRLGTTSIPPAHWGLEDLGARGLGVAGVPLRDIIDRWGSPVHVVDERALRRNAEDFLAPAPGSAPLEVFYSYKSNPVPDLLRLLDSYGIGAEVTSAYELWLAFRLGVAPERIIINGVIKEHAALVEAARRGVALVNLNHIEEVDRLVAAAREAGTTLRVGVRITLPSSWSGQFGNAVTGGLADQAIARVRACPELQLVGVHVHFGGLLRTQEAVRVRFGELLDYLTTQEEKGFLPEVLDVGGSLAIPTVNHPTPRERRLNSAFGRPLPVPSADSCLTIREYVAVVMETVTAHYRGRGLPVPRIMVEPGRALTGNAQLLLATVAGLRRSIDKNYALLDTGTNHAEVLRGEIHQMLPVDPPRGGGERVYTVVGPSSSPGDVLYDAWTGPELQEGDVLAIMDAGAYFVPYSTCFSQPRPGIIAIGENGPWVMRRPETFDDLVAYDAFFSGAPTA